MAIVGDLVANLAVNSAPFTGGLGKAQGALGKFASGIGGTLGMVGGIIGAVGAPLAAVFGLKEAISGFRESEQAAKKLDAVLLSTGGAAGVGGDEIRTLAADLQRVTNFEDDATISAAGVLATFKEIKGDTFKQAIVSAQDLSAVMGQDLQSSVVQIGKALNDPIKGVTALRRVGVSFTQEQLAQIKNLQTAGDLAGAQAIIMSELQSEFGGAAKAMADPLTVLGNMIGDIAEGIGSAVVPALNEIANAIVSSIVPAGQTMQEMFTNVGTVLTDWVHTAIEFVRDGITLLGFAIENWQAIAEVAFLNAGAAALGFAGQVEHFFTGVLPALFTWFSENWNNVWFTALDTVLTVLINIGTNVRNLFSEIWEFVSSGGQVAFEFAFTPLLDGAVSTLSKLPEIPDRVMSDLEKTMRADADRIGSELGDRLGETMLANASTAVEKPTFTPPDLSGAGKGDTGLQSSKTKGAGAALAGSKEALSSIFGSMRDDKLQERIAAAAERQLAEAERTNDLLEGMADDTEVVDI